MQEHPTAQVWGWWAIGLGLSALAATLAWYSHLFGYAYELKDLPALPLAAGLCLAGLIYLPVLYLIRQGRSLDAKALRHLLIVIIGFGLLMRGLLFWSEPALEDDYQRYLWDGAVSSAGLNPYAAAPEAAKTTPRFSIQQRLIAQSGKVHERINHPGLKTIYPPVAQGAFALAHLIQPWSMLAWRLVCFLGEAATLALLLTLLRETGRSPLWVALYWWNPVVIKELVNSAHMEAILMPFILAAFLLAIRQRVLAATLALGLAMGTKLWPVMLAPLIWRQALNRPKLIAVAGLMLAALAVLWALPPYIGGLDKTSGFVAYAQRWKTGSALFPQMEALVRWLLDALHMPETWAPITARGLVAALLGALILALAVPPLGRARFFAAAQTSTPPNDQDKAQDLMTRGALACAALVLLVPSQFPWYTVWLIPFLCFLPSIGLLSITAFIPLYYTAFYFIAQDQKQVFTNVVVWYIWLPVWAILAAEFWWHQTSWRRWDGGQGLRRRGRDHA